MLELLKFIFSSPWVWLGTVGLMLVATVAVCLVCGVVLRLWVASPKAGSSE